MHILITAGGTREPIDSVRSITNTSTGRLASIIHKHWVNYRLTSGLPLTIHYVVATPAVMPLEDDQTILYRVSDTFSVEETIKDILENHQIDNIIHLMAISDYYVTNVQSKNDLAQNLESYIKGCQEDGIDLTRQLLRKFLSTPNPNFQRGISKISSKSDMILTLGQTPKIISELKSLSPKSRLVGFKLLDNVSEETLVTVAKEQFLKNQCEFVVANDLQHITNETHKAIIVKDNQIIHRCESKDDIAKAIIKELTQ